MAEGIEIQMSKLLKEIDDSAKGAMKDSIRAVAREAAQKLRSTSPKKTGEYAKGWTVKRLGDKDAVVYNRTHAWRTHLLERGHVIKNGRGTYGRTRAIVHIKPVEEWAAEELPRKILNEVD